MSNLAVCILFIAAVHFSILAQTASPPSIKNDAPSNANRQPPALAGDSRKTVQAATAKPTPAAEDEVIDIDTNLVTTPVSVLDRNGRFIPGLRKRDFKIFENGIQQKITYFQSEEQPFTVILMIDISPSTKYHIDEIHYAAVTFVNQLRPNDKVMVVAFDQRVKALSEPTNDRQKLYGAIYKAQFGSGTSLYDAVDAVTSLDLLNAPGRKAVVIFTDGVDTTSRRADFASTVAGVEEIDALFYPIRYNTQRASGVVSSTTGSPAALPPDIVALMAARGIAIDPRAFRGAGRGQSPAEYEKGRFYLETLATNSGGRMFEAETLTNLETSFAGVAEELRRQYSVGYYPDDTGQPGDRRKIKIQVARPKVVVRSKTTYVIADRAKRETPGT